MEGVSASSVTSNFNPRGSLTSSSGLKRKSGDIGWDYGELVDPHNLDKIKCNLCNKVFSGGVYRLKQHVACKVGNVSSCPKASPLDKAQCLRALEGAKKKKQQKKESEQKFRSKIQVTQERMNDDVVEVNGTSSNSPHTLCLMDKWTCKINPNSSFEAHKAMQQQHINDAPFKSKANEVHSYLAKWVYEAGIPFSAISSDSFHHFCEAVGQFGRGYIPPSQYQLQEPLLKEEVKKTKESLKKHEEEWAKNGCSILLDTWTNRKQRRIMNFWVNCKAGTRFLSSIEGSIEAQTEQCIIGYVDKYIKEIGPQNVVQVVMDNFSNTMAVAKLLKNKWPNTFCTSCATHTLDLILEEIGKILVLNKVIEKAKALTVFIYSHDETYSMMRKFTKKKHIVRPGITRSASSFFTLQNMSEKSESLKFMFLSNEWDSCKLSSSPKGQEAYETITSLAFWSNINTCVEVFKPLVKVLRLVVGDWTPSMGFVYGEFKDAKKEIMKVCRDDEDLYKPILEVIDANAKDRLDSPLHLAGYFLNPYYYYRNDEVEKNLSCMEAILTCVESFFPDDDESQHIVCNVELFKYKKMEGIFGEKLATLGRIDNDENFDPVNWWSNYGVQTPKLRMMAMKLLSLTTSSLGCERNQRTFEGICSKRSTLDAKRLNDLVYVHLNAKILNNKKMTREKGDILLANDARMAQEWLAEGSDDEQKEGSQVSRVIFEDITELHGDDFKSDNEVDVNTEDTIFEDSDQEFR